eukprot:2524479-Pleurochrysis_carterae.AAC.3
MFTPPSPPRGCAHEYHCQSISVRLVQFLRLVFIGTVSLDAVRFSSAGLELRSGGNSGLRDET